MERKKKIIAEIDRESNRIYTYIMHSPSDLNTWTKKKHPQNTYLHEYKQRDILDHTILQQQQQQWLFLLKK